MRETLGFPEGAQAEVLAFLADPATHGVPAGGVRRVQTHISELFLAGDRAFKVKRAVRFAFADFTTLEARRAACEAEVSLNRRTAPDLYLGTAAVRRDRAGRLTLDQPGRAGEGQAIEWAVAMRRFDDTLTFDRLADRDQLRPEWIDGTADSIIAMHGAAETHGAPYGGCRALEQVIEENQRDMSDLPEDFATARLESLLADQRRLLAENADLLEARRDAGQVRRCHGDLHLGNIVLWRDRPVIFDCIEFSESLAIIDLAYDLAFLLMDLEVRGFRALANRLLGRYLGRQGGVELLALLPLMLSIRACVRAKIAALTAGKARDAAQARDNSLRARRLFAAAEHFVAPTTGPLLVAVGGFSGSGKSTLAAALAPLLGRAPGALLLRSDVIRKRLANLLPEERLPASAYSQKANTLVYETAVREASEALAAGQCVVVDAVFGRERERRAIETAAAGRPFVGLWLEAPAATLKTRVLQRTRDASDATPDVLARQLAMDTGEIAWQRLDGAQRPQTALAAALALLPAPIGSREEPGTP